MTAVEYKGTRGFVSSAYLSATKPAGTTTAQVTKESIDALRMDANADTSADAGTSAGGLITTRAQIFALKLGPTMYAKTNGSNLLLRAEPRDGADIVARIPNGDPVETYICDTTAGWAAAEYKGNKGFVSSAYLSSDRPATADTAARPGADPNDQADRAPIIGPDNTHDKNNTTMLDKIKSLLEKPYVSIPIGVGLGIVIDKFLLSKNSPRKGLSGFGRKDKRRRKSKEPQKLLELK